MKPKVLVLDRQEAVGEAQGRKCFVFDTGCNLSGPRKIHMFFNYSNYKNIWYPGKIKRITFEFESPAESGENYSCPHYPKAKNRFGVRERIFEVDRNDFIVGVGTWMQEGSVCGIRFLLDSGFVSEIFGAPSTFAPGKTFVGQHPGSRLVGVHGVYGENIQTLGCTFATVTPFILASTAPFYGDLDPSPLKSKKEEDESSAWSTVSEQTDLRGRNINDVLIHLLLLLLVVVVSLPTLRFCNGTSMES